LAKFDKICLINKLKMSEKKKREKEEKKEEE